MKGNPKVIAELNAALRDELLAINQYFLHAEMLENWKYSRLAKYIKKQSIDEMRHAEGLIERILFLDGTPNLTEPMKLDVGLNVKQQLERQLRLEIVRWPPTTSPSPYVATRAITQSRELFLKMLHDEEGHVDWLEAQLHQIQELGYERYLSEQIKEPES
jgi:bacterioferritin